MSLNLSDHVKVKKGEVFKLRFVLLFAPITWLAMHIIELVILIPCLLLFFTGLVFTASAEIINRSFWWINDRIGNVYQFKFKGTFELSRYALKVKITTTDKEYDK